MGRPDRFREGASTGRRDSESGPLTVEVASAPTVETAAAPTIDTTPAQTADTTSAPTIDTTSVSTIATAVPGTIDTIPIPTIDTAEMAMIDSAPMEGALPQGDRSARPVVLGQLRRAGSTAVTAVRTVGWWFNSILGGQDYRRYVDHLARNHPGCEIPTEREYWRKRHADADHNPTNRCC